MVRQWQVPTAFRVPLSVWKKSTYFLRAVSRYPHLDPGHYSFELLVTGWHSAPVLSRQSMVVFGRISGIIYVVSAPESSAHGNLDATSTSLCGWSLQRNAWLNSGYMFLYSLRRLMDEFPIFLRAGFTWILRSIHVLLSRVFSLVSESTV